MLSAVRERSHAILRVQRKSDGLYLYSEAGMHRLEPKNSRTVRITYTQASDFVNEIKPGIVPSETYGDWEYTENKKEIRLLMKHLQIVINRETASCQYYSGDGRRLLREREEHSKCLEAFTVYELLEENISIEKINTPDGVKEIVRDAARIPVGKSYHTRLYLEWEEQEALYGLGQHEEGFASLRGQTVYLHQGNRKIAVPVLVSTQGYGILMNTYSPMIFSDTIYGSYLYTEADPEMDYYFMNGDSMEGVIREYRLLTGKAALLPRWAFGYIQSQERYETQQEILDIVKKYRESEIGLDGIVLDWLSWEENQWGQKSFDSKRFPDPKHMIKALHGDHVHFMISIWPNMDEKTENYKEFQESELLLPGSNIYNALRPDGREMYWNQVKRGLFCHGVDAWWCDNSEPFTPEWNHRERMEPAKLYEEYCRVAGTHLPAERMNAYVLYHAMALYEGQRNDGEKRVVNLTRSAYTGMQRYGTISWSGDIEASWDTFRRQIAAGLNFCASGLPFWTVDIGAFFVKRGNLWFWRGDYEKGTDDLGYRELFVRWYQWGCFLPIFRGHGTDCRRELWQFSNTEVPFYDALLGANRLRYELMPYIYSLAGLCWLQDASMIKLLAFEYPKDRTVWNITDQYLFGNSIMVCPVLHPMYYAKDSRPLSDISMKRRIYLPKGNGWYDYWTNRYFKGGQWIEVEAPLEKIPLFVREGSILPKTEPAQSTEELSREISIFIYAGRNGEFTLYEDEGEGYGYEQGQYRLTRIRWNDRSQKLSYHRLHSGWNGEKAIVIKKEIVIHKNETIL